MGLNSAKNNYTLFPFSVHCPALLDSYFTPSPLTLNTASPSIITFIWWPTVYIAENTDNHTSQSSRHLPAHLKSAPSLLLLGQFSVLQSPLLCTLHPIAFSYSRVSPAISSLSFLNHSFPLSTESFPLALDVQSFSLCKTNHSHSFLPPLPPHFSAHLTKCLGRVVCIHSLLFLSSSLLLRLLSSTSTLPQSCSFKVINYFHYVRHAGEGSVLSLPGSAAVFDLVGLSLFTCFLWTRRFPGVCPTSSHPPWLFFFFWTKDCSLSGLHPQSPCTRTWTSSFFYFLSIFTSLMNSSSPMQMTSKFISSPDPTSELQTHFSTATLAIALGCPLTTFWTAHPNLLLPSLTYLSQCQLHPSSYLEIQTWPWLLCPFNVRAEHWNLTISHFLTTTPFLVQVTIIFLLGYCSNFLPYLLLCPLALSSLFSCSVPKLKSLQGPTRPCNTRTPALSEITSFIIMQLNTRDTFWEMYARWFCCSVYTKERPFTNLAGRAYYTPWLYSITYYFQVTR